jgi:hypothetical protein
MVFVHPPPLSCTLGMFRRLLAQEDFSGGTQALSGLGRTLVLSGLQADDALAGAQLLVGEVTLVFLGGAGSQPWSGPLGVTVGLQEQHQFLAKMSFFGVIMILELVDIKFLRCGQGRRGWW